MTTRGAGFAEALTRFSATVREDFLATIRAAVTFFLAFLRRQPIGAFALFVVCCLGLTAALAPLIAPYNPLVQDIPGRLSGPSIDHFWGTDELGRDVFSRTIYGLRLSLLVAAMAVILGTIPGMLLGVISAYAGGKLDALIQTVSDGILAMPALVVGLAVVAVLGPSTQNVIVAISILFVPISGRVVRAAALQVKASTYIEAARALGCSPPRIIFHHMVPNSFAPYLVIASALIVDAIVVEAALSFLGFGVPPPNPSLGQSLKRAMPFMETAPWLVISPGLAIAVIVFCTSLLADAVRDHLDPRLRGSR